MKKQSTIQIISVGNEMELSFEGETFYTGKEIGNLQIIKEIRSKFGIGLFEANEVLKQADRLEN